MNTPSLEKINLLQMYCKNPYFVKLCVTINVLGCIRFFAFLFSALFFKLGLNRLPEKEAIILLHVLSKLLIELVTELILFFSKFLFLFHFRPRIDLNGKWYFIGLQSQYIFFQASTFQLYFKFWRSYSFWLAHFEEEPVFFPHVLQTCWNQVSVYNYAYV